MASIIDYTYFIRDLNIPNVTGISGTPQNDELQSFIDRYEPECLENLLGYELYKLFQSEVSDRMSWLKSGTEYSTSSGSLRKWSGLVYDPKVSLIASYVYFKVMQNRASYTTGVSQSVIATEGGQTVSPALKMVDAWSFFSESVRKMGLYIWTKNETDNLYPEFDYNQLDRLHEFSKPINLWNI